jgi:iron(III) transport system substrate-binding protein
MSTTRLHVSRAGYALGMAIVSACLASAVVPARAAGAITVYAAQHEQTVDLLTKAFTKETGVDVKVHTGSKYGCE